MRATGPAGPCPPMVMYGIHNHRPGSTSRTAMGKFRAFSALSRNARSQPDPVGELHQLCAVDHQVHQVDNGRTLISVKAWRDGRTIHDRRCRRASHRRPLPARPNRSHRSTIRRWEVPRGSWGTGWAGGPCVYVTREGAVCLSRNVHGPPSCPREARPVPTSPASLGAHGRRQAPGTALAWGVRFPFLSQGP